MDNMTDDELQAWLLGDGVLSDVVAATAPVWDAALKFHDHTRDWVGASQYRRDEDEADALHRFADGL